MKTLALTTLLLLSACGNTRSARLSGIESRGIYESISYSYRLYLDTDLAAPPEVIRERRRVLDLWRSMIEEAEAKELAD